MEIHKDDRKWVVRLHFDNENCPNLYFPCNYHGCSLLTDVTDDKCTFENCPFKVGAVEERTLNEESR